jgi:hypothetical protein
MGRFPLGLLRKLSWAGMSSPETLLSPRRRAIGSVSGTLPRGCDWLNDRKRAGLTKVSPPAGDTLRKGR